MQAGDRLDFIKPFSGTEHQSDDDGNHVDENDLLVLATFMKRFINDRPENIKSFEILEPFGIITVFESSYKLDMPDDSCLHIVVFGTQTEIGLLRFGISVNEHLPNGAHNGGYSYIYDDEGFLRSYAPAEDAGKTSEDDITGFMMISDMYEFQDALQEQQMSEDIEVQEHARMVQQVMTDELQFDDIMQAAGFDRQPPYPGELEKLRELIWDAKPFPLHLND